MAQVFGVGIDELQKTLANNRYFYGLRRTDAGELYMVKSDLLRLEDGVQLNRPGNIDENYNNWSRGEDFFEGRDQQHRKTYPNLVYEQYKWDGRNLFYYVNKEGELVLKVNEAHTYVGYVEPYSS
jgi:hypothetical protein|tara:strand:- start:139 stop:513 length:375 start_codon:yes stop_codon:yes gene_type:complete